MSKYHKIDCKAETPLKPEQASEHSYDYTKNTDSNGGWYLITERLPERNCLCKVGYSNDRRDGIFVFNPDTLVYDTCIYTELIDLEGNETGIHVWQTHSKDHLCSESIFVWKYLESPTTLTRG